MSVWDLDNYTDAVSDAVDAVGDVASSIATAGKEIGMVLKSVAPFASMIPGFGSAIGIAVYAAGAAAAADKIDEAVIGMASAAMPPGIPRIAFDGAAAITQDIAKGRNVWESTVKSCRQAAQVAGGANAVAAFDSGMAVFKGGPVDQRIIDQGRKFALTSGGQSAAAAYDAGVGVARAEGADQILLGVGRNYVRDAGGPLAAAAFDAGVALGYGKTLQEAGWTGLHTFVKGNDGMEQILNFVEAVGRGKRLNIAVQDVLASDLGHAVTAHLIKQGSGVMASQIKRKLQPYMEAITSDPAILDYPAGELAKEWGIDEVVLRAAQAVMRDLTVDDGLISVFAATAPRKPLTTLTAKMDPSAIQVASAFDTPGMAVINSARKKEGLAIIAANPDLQRVYKLPASLPQGLTDEMWRRGFAIGVAVSAEHTEPGPGQDAGRDALMGASQYNGFMAARAAVYSINRTKQMIQQAAQLASIEAEAALKRMTASRLADKSSKTVAVALKTKHGFIDNVLIFLGFKKGD